MHKYVVRGHTCIYCMGTFRYYVVWEHKYLCCMGVCEHMFYENMAEYVARQHAYTHIVMEYAYECCMGTRTNMFYELCILK